MWLVELAIFSDGFIFQLFVTLEWNHCTIDSIVAEEVWELGKLSHLYVWGGLTSSHVLVPAQYLNLGISKSVGNSGQNLAVT